MKEFNKEPNKEPNQLSEIKAEMIKYTIYIDDLRDVIILQDELEKLFNQKLTK
jgi:hypothetical protein